MLVGSYLMFEAHSYSGFYAWVCEWQISVFGSYAPFLSFLFLLAIGVLPLLLILTLIRKSRRREPDVVRAANLRIERAVTIRNSARGIFAVAFGLLLVALLFVTFVLPSDDGEPVTVTVSENSSIPLREGSARLVGGEVGTMFTFGQSWLLGEHRKFYAVYQVPGPNREGATFFVDLGSVGVKQLSNLRQRTTWSGLLVKGGLPGTTRPMLRSAGIKLTDPYYTLYPDRRTLQASYFVQLGQMALLALLLALVSVFYNRYIARLQREINTAARRTV
jgi:hypothetical protein